MADPVSVNLDSTIGVIFIGLIVTGFLFGVITAQSGWYFKHYPQDRPLLKVLVVGIWVLDSIDLGLYFSTIFVYFVRKQALKYGQQSLPWMANLQLLCNACAICVIQSYYASRIWTLSRRKLLLAVMVSFIAVTWVFSVVLFFKTIFTLTVADYVRLAPYDIFMSAMIASTDTLLCGALVYLLSSSRTGTRGADLLINKLLFYTVNTGLLTSIFAVMSVIMVVIIPGSSVFVMFYYIGARLYSVSLLATLNARLGLRIQAERMGQHTLPEIEITTHPVNKGSQSLQISRRSATVPAPCSSNTGTTSTEEGTATASQNESGSALSASRLHYDGARCYMASDGGLGGFDLSWGQDLRDKDVHPIDVVALPESRGLPER